MFWRTFSTQRTYTLFRQNRWQVIIGFNVLVGIAALTFYQRYTGIKKLKKSSTSRGIYNTDEDAIATPIADANRSEQERLAVQILVNERRALKGLPPYKYPTIVEHPNAD